MPADQRLALLKNMAASLFIHEQILTTEARAKELKRFAERLINLAKEDTVPRRRAVQKVLPRPPLKGKLMQKKAYREKEHPEREVVRKLFTEIAPRYRERQGGYVRVIKAPPRRGDAAPMAVVMLTGTEAE